MTYLGHLNRITITVFHTRVLEKRLLGANRHRGAPEPVSSFNFSRVIQKLAGIVLQVNIKG